jgi:hypothetical protein
MPQCHPELLARDTGRNSEGALSAVHADAEPVKHPVTQDAPVSKGAAPEQGFANKYNWHQFPLGKTRTKSSINRRIRTRFAFLLSGLAMRGSGTSTASTLGSMVQEGVVS